MDADGKNNKMLTTSAKSESDAIWTANGEKIAFLCDGQIWEMNADGSNRRQLTKEKRALTALCFHPMKNTSY